MTELELENLRLRAEQQVSESVRQKDRMQLEKQACQIQALKCCALQTELGYEVLVEELQAKSRAAHLAADNDAGWPFCVGEHEQNLQGATELGAYANVSKLHENSKKLHHELVEACEVLKAEHAQQVATYSNELEKLQSEVSRLSAAIRVSRAESDEIFEMYVAAWNGTVDMNELVQMATAFKESCSMLTQAKAAWDADDEGEVCCSQLLLGNSLELLAHRSVKNSSMRG